MIENAAFVDNGNLKRGQLRVSLRAIGRAWGWNEQKVRRWLESGAQAAQIRYETDAHGATITICNYDKYQTTKSGADAQPTHIRSGTDAQYKEKEKEDEDSPSGESPPVSPKRGSLNVGRRKKHRLPPDWEPDEQDRQYARTCGFDPDWLLVEFRDYWTDPDIRNALHSDWSRVWQRRCRDLYARKGSNGIARSRQDVGRDQGVVAVARKLIAETPDD
jgi:hypothetical protein